MNTSDEPVFEAPSGGAISVGSLIAVCLLAFGVVWAVKPDRNELVSILLADGDYERAMEVSGVDSMGSMIGYLISENHSKVIAEADVSKLQIAVNMVQDTEETLVLLKDKSDRFTAEGYHQLLGTLATRALHMEEPQISSRIYEAMAEGLPLDDRDLLSAIQAFRFSENPYGGYLMISRQLEQRQIGFHELSSDIRRIALELLQESDRIDVAFEVLANEFGKRVSVEEYEASIEELMTVATLAGRVEDTMPILEEFLGTTEAGKRSWKQLLSDKSSLSTNSDFDKYAKTLAHYYEWNARSEEAFELYLKLAAMGDSESLERCIVISSSIRRERDLFELFSGIQPERLGHDYRLLMARLTADFGTLESAEEIYRSILQKEHPQKASVWQDLGQLLFMESNRLEDALEAFQNAIRLDPSLADSRIQVAGIQVALGNFEDALKSFQSMPDEIHTVATIEDFQFLAKSLGSYDDIIRTIRWKMNNSGRPHPDDYNKIAYYWTLGGDDDKAEAVISEGLMEFPREPSLVISMADHLFRAKDFEKAYELLLKTYEIDGDDRYLARLIYAGVSINKFTDILKIVKEDDPLATSWPESTRLRLAELYEKSGDGSRALAIYRSIPEGDLQALRLLAKKAFDANQYEEALQYQLQYMDKVKETSHFDWIFVGEIYHSVDQPELSRKASVRALELLKERLFVRPSIWSPPKSLQEPGRVLNR